MMRRLGAVLFALALAASAIQVPACEYDPTKGPQSAGQVTDVLPDSQPVG